MMIKCDSPTYGRALAVSTDLTHWDTVFLPKARGSLAVDDEGTVRVGTKVVWTPARGFVAD